MSGWWIEAAHFIHSYGAAIGFIFFLIIIMGHYMVIPWIKKLIKAVHKMFFFINQIYEADLHPDRKDAKGYAVLLTRRELFAAFEQSKAYVAEIRAMKDILSGKLCTENCPAFKQIADSLAQRRQQEQEFMDHLLELRRATQEEVKRI